MILSSEQLNGGRIDLYFTDEEISSEGSNNQGQTAS